MTAPRTVDWSAFDATRVDPAVIPVVRATCLLESRSSLYGAYLVSVLPGSMAEQVTAWAAEEAHHGRALRRWLALADPGFDVDAALARLEALPYHEAEDEPRRGGAAHELVSRCVVEALASGFYAALAGSTDEPLLRQISLRLMDDERRHLRQFAAMRDSLPTLPRSVRLRVAAGRLRELGDDQIAFAVHCADGGDRYRRGRSRRRHRARVWPLYDMAAVTHCLALLAEAAGTQRTDPPRPVRIPLVRPLAWPASLVLRSLARFA